MNIHEYEWAKYYYIICFLDVLVACAVILSAHLGCSSLSGRSGLFAPAALGTPQSNQLQMFRNTFAHLCSGKSKFNCWTPGGALETPNSMRKPAAAPHSWPTPFCDLSAAEGSVMSSNHVKYFIKKPLHA